MDHAESGNHLMWKFEFRIRALHVNNIQDRTSVFLIERYFSDPTGYKYFK